MNVTLLIGAIVRQTTVLIAELATAGGVRAPLAHVADKVFMDLVRELERQGVSRKVSADMFGMGLLSYLRRIQRLSGRSLWEAVLHYLQARGVVSRAEVFARFHRDDEVLVRGVLPKEANGAPCDSFDGCTSGRCSMTIPALRWRRSVKPASILAPKGSLAARTCA